MNTNRKAFLDMIAISEGTYGKGDNGYNIIVGGSTFHDYSRHPNLKVWIKSINDYSTCAGRYQLKYRYWPIYCKQLGLKGFGPNVQDAIAIQQIKEQRALGDVDLGYISSAIKKCANIWASFPAAGYGQRENKMDFLLRAFSDAKAKYD